jgi:hypothetical protein
LTCLNIVFDSLLKSKTRARQTRYGWLIIWNAACRMKPKAGEGPDWKVSREG